MEQKVTNRNVLEESAKRMTEIVQAALDKLPPAERARKLKAYLSKKPRATSSSSSSRGLVGLASKASGSPRIQGYRVAARSR